jgi:excinuclease UvrABC helicase subunit UvrB
MYVSATPGPYERRCRSRRVTVLEPAERPVFPGLALPEDGAQGPVYRERVVEPGRVVEQLIRPTGML